MRAWARSAREAPAAAAGAGAGVAPGAGAGAAPGADTGVAPVAGAAPPEACVGGFRWLRAAEDSGSSVPGSSPETVAFTAWMSVPVV